VKPACPRVFEAEALRDGRLSGAELKRFQTHLDLCAACARETRELEGLADALRSKASSATADELHVRRERTRLLAAFDGRLVPGPRGGRERLWLGSAAVLAVLALTVVLWHSRSTPHVTPVAALVDSVNVRAEASTKWSRQAEARSETVRLESGTLSIHVDHALSPQRRLLVILPDGELEDIGTTFSVTAVAAHTTQVTVQDGRVILRVHGKPALALSAGDSWSPAPAPVAVAVAVATITSPPFTPTARSPRSAPSSSSSSSSASASISALPPTPDPATDFRDAMSALNGGDNNRAAALFSVFLARHSADSHAEDAAYLRVLALQRAGKASAMKQAANEYLRQYPDGFRHDEVEPLSR
jgi:FecR protein